MCKSHTNIRTTWWVYLWNPSIQILMLKTSNAALQSSLQQALVCPILIQDRTFPGREFRVLYACTHTLITPCKHIQVLFYLFLKVHQIQNKTTLDSPNYTTSINRRGNLQVTYLKAFLTSSMFPDQSKYLGMDHFLVTSYFQLLTFLVQV